MASLRRSLKAAARQEGGSHIRLMSGITNGCSGPETPVIGIGASESFAERRTSPGAPFIAMTDPALPPGTTQRTLAIIMGGGARSPLFPLTKDRAKPAVALGGKDRLVDIPISNCLNSGLRSIYILTQFNTMSLHRHIQASYKFDNFSRSFVDILAAQ